MMVKLLSVVSILISTSILISDVEGCGPGSFLHSKRRLPRRMLPLVLKESYPSQASEMSLHASGPNNDDVISADSEKFRNLLVPNYNSAIVFSDGEGNGEDRLMTRRAKERLDVLAISVMNLFPGVKLRVLEAYDLEMIHGPKSLHYSGRAIDVSSSDRDRSKLGMIARLAVEAGFDFVSFRSRYHVHISVKSDSSNNERAGGCFSGDSTVETKDGPKMIKDLEINEFVKAVKNDGGVIYSPVIMFLDIDKKQRLNFRIATEKHEISLTPHHMLFVVRNKTESLFEESYITFAKDIEIGDYIFVNEHVSGFDRIELSQVTNITTHLNQGHVAPLTAEGTIIVNGVVASSYAFVQHDVAHTIFAPVRLLLNAQASATYLLKRLKLMDIKTRTTVAKERDGLNYYAKLLIYLSNYILPNTIFSYQ